MNVLVTGAAGFIGFHIARALLAHRHRVTGLDNINEYYDPELKYARLKELGISREAAHQFNMPVPSETYGEALHFVRINLEDREPVAELFRDGQFDVVCHLAAQAGVRYSLENPEAYISSNIVGFLNILECCRHYAVKHLVYASSSSVYGENAKVPFSVGDRTDNPISLYAATKKSNELMASTYSHLYGFPTTGLRFFTVYGPWGRPDMALFLFTKAILKGEPVKVFNRGKMERDFTYIDDIAGGVLQVIEEDLTHRTEAGNRNKLYNIGNNKPVQLLKFIAALEAALGKKARLDLLPMQPGDVARTWADVTDLMERYHFRPDTPIDDGIKAFVDWYLEFYETHPRQA